MKLLVKFQGCVSLLLGSGFCYFKFIFQRCAVHFSSKGKIIDCSKHYKMNLAIKMLQLQTGTELLESGSYMDLECLETLSSWDLMTAAIGLQLFPAQDLSVCISGGVSSVSAFKCSDALRRCQILEEE